MNFEDRNRAAGGFSLVELLVVMVLLGVIGGVVTAAIVGSLRSASQTSARLEATNELRLAMQRITRDLRTADELLIYPDRDLAYDLSVDIDTNFDTVREVRYQVDTVDGRDTLERIDGGASALITQLGNGEDEPVFTYRNSVGSVINCAPPGNEVCAQASQVRILLVRDQPGNQPSIRIESVVSFRNTRFRG